MIRIMVAACLAVATLAGCGSDQPEPASAPQVGQCRYLTEADLTGASNESPVVKCQDLHTAYTYAVGTLPEEFTTQDDPGIDTWLYRTCADKFRDYTGADESRSMRAIITWAWWRPNASQWSGGDRAFRCDIIGGSTPLLELPRKLKGVLHAPEDKRWMVCATGAALDSDAVRVACNHSHDWRAVTTIKLGEPGDPFPGDRKSAKLARQYCSASVSAWLGYPVGYDLGFTWFSELEWAAGQSEGSVLGANQRLNRLRGTDRLGMLAGILALLACAGCGGNDQPPQAPQPSPSRTIAAAPPAAPADRDCYRLTYDEALAPSSGAAAVDCAKGHTSQTFLVGDLPTASDGHLLAVDSETVRTRVSQTCRSALPDFLGVNLDQLHLTVLRAVWFTPTNDQVADGANWFRCDVVAVSADSTLATLTGGLSGDLADATVRAGYGICGTASPDSEDFRRVICSADHSWRALELVQLPKGDYPGEGAVRAAGRDQCEQAAQDVADNALDFQWGYEWPSAEQWATGQTWGLCWAPA